MQEVERQRTKKAGLPHYLVAVMALLAVISMPGAARAQWNCSGGTCSTSGNVGVGPDASSPPMQLTVARQSADTDPSNWSNNPPTLLLRNTSPTANNYSGLVFGNAASSTYFTSAVVGFNEDHTTTPSGHLSFFTKNAGAWAERVRVSATGQLGVGTSSPGYLLDVVSGNQWAARFKKTDATHGGIIVEAAANYNPNVALSSGGVIKWYINSNAQNSGSPDALQLWESSGGYPRLTVTQSGNVGIGAAANNPAHTLEVAGTINASGGITGSNISATYQDVAEWVPSTQKLATGTVVVLDTAQTNHVLASTTSYDTAVAGVVSERPGIALGEGGDGKVLVATTGRVRVKVDATRAPIRVGDLLVTSDKEGVAMRSEPVMVGGRKMHAPGTIIGKALEPLDKGTGEILVLLSLQ